MDTLRILWFNWRCIKNPEAGGAEVFTHEIAKRLAKLGHEITLVTSRASNLPSEEELDGYRVIRSGNRYTVYINSRYIYVKKFVGKVDLVIDEINTIPFFTIKYVKEPVIALIHQLAREYWLLEVKPPISWIGYLLEPHYLKLYKDTTTITVSQSTKNDLLNLGFRDVHIVPEAVSYTHLTLPTN